MNHPTPTNHIIKLAEQLHRMNILDKYGFTEQNNVAVYQQKLANNKPAQTMHKAKALAKNASLFLDRCVGLA
jgi:hypothetical protein